MNIEDVRAFAAVVETGSVGRAALRLKLTQPAISRRIQRLEAALGVALLDRDSKPARPTPAGEAAYGRCMAVLRAMQALISDRPGPFPAGPLRIGIPLGLADAAVVPAVDALQYNLSHFDNADIWFEASYELDQARKGIVHDGRLALLYGRARLAIGQRLPTVTRLSQRPGLRGASSNLT